MTASQINEYCVEIISEKDSNSALREKYTQELLEFYRSHKNCSHKKPWTSQRIEEVIEQVKRTRVSMQRESSDYYWISKYDVMETSEEEFLIFKKKSVNDPTVRIVALEEYFDILTEVHKAVGHGGREKMTSNIKNQLHIPKKAIEKYLKLCTVCEMKRSMPKKKEKKKAIETKQPITLTDFNSRGQVDLIDFQSVQDGEYKWLMNYQDHATKFLHLRPLKSKKAVEVAFELLKIFLEFGAPLNLQSDNGKEFTARLIEELVQIWPDCKIVHGGPKTQGSVEHSKQDVENLLHCWMKDNDSHNWSVGCYFVQYNINSSVHSIIGRSPYSALFGSDPKTLLKGTHIPDSVSSSLQTEMKNGSTENLLVETSSQYLIISEAALTPVVDIVVEDDDPATAEKNTKTCVSDISPSINVANEREQSRKGTKRAAEKMIDQSAENLPLLEIGNSVLVNVPKFDRGPYTTKHIAGKIVDITNGMFKIGTTSGTLKSWFPRQDLQISAEEYNGVISETLITLRHAVTCQSMIVGPGFQKCPCKPVKNQCCTKRCACYKNRVLCTSKCHKKLTCMNK